MSEPKINIGLTSEVYSGRVDADAAIAYALATNDPNEIYEKGGAVPPLYTVSLVLPSYLVSHGQAADQGAIEGVTGGVHGEHDVYFHSPIEPGSPVQWQNTVHAATQTPAGVLVTVKLLVSDPGGRPLVEHYWSTLMIGGKIAADAGTPLAPHAFPPEASERPLGSHRTYVTGDQSFRYAGASTDHAAFHVDDEAARSAGFPSKFMQGLCTFAMCSGAVVKIAAGGDPDRLKRLACRFSAPVFPRNELEVSVYDGGTTDTGRRVAVFEAESAGATAIKHGWAELD